MAAKPKSRQTKRPVLGLRRRINGRLAALIVAVVIIALGVVAVVSSRAAGITGPLVPSSGLILGMMSGATGIANRESQLGRTMYINHKFYAWTNFFFSDQYSGWPSDDAAKGRTRLVTWEPHGVSLDSIISGAQDANIVSHANESKGYGKPFFLRFAHEMNGNWYSWSGPQNGGAAGAAKYVKAWQHIHDIFQRQGATNAIFTWCPNGDSVPGGGYNTYQSYYPGDAYVDWVCLDAYSQGSGPSFASMYQNFYNQYASKKPMMVGEVSSEEYGGSKKASFITQMQADLKSKFPNIKAIVWFDINKEKDWRIDSNATTFAAWKAMANDPYFMSKPGGTVAATPTPVTGTPTPKPTVTATPAPGTSPDLIVSAIGTVAASPQPGQPVKLTATVKNQGNAATPNGTITGVAFEVDGLKFWSDTYSASIPAGGTVTLTANGGAADDGAWTPAAAGSYSVKATADDIDRIAESNETNNVRTQAVVIGGAAATPTATPVATATPVPGTAPKGDLNADGKVNALDLSILLSGWGRAGGDLNGDGTTGILDLSILISNWGK